MHAFSPRTSGGKCQLKIFTKLVVSFPFLSLERGQKQRSLLSPFLSLERGQKQRSLLSPSTTGREKGKTG